MGIDMPVNGIGITKRVLIIEVRSVDRREPP